MSVVVHKKKILGIYINYSGAKSLAWQVNIPTSPHFEISKSGGRYLLVLVLLFFFFHCGYEGLAIIGGAGLNSLFQ